MKRIILTLLPAALLACLAANGQTPTSSLAELRTTDGKTYRNVAVLKTDPGGILIQFQPQPEGLGFARLEYQTVPESLRAQYGYNQERAAAYAAEQAQATAQWRAQLLQEAAVLERYRAVAELHRRLAGDEMAWYSVSLSADGKISAQGTTGSMLSYGYPYSYPYSWWGGSPEQSRQSAEAQLGAGWGPPASPVPSRPTPLSATPWGQP